MVFRVDTCVICCCCWKREMTTPTMNLWRYDLPILKVFSQFNSGSDNFYRSTVFMLLRWLVVCDFVEILFLDVKNGKNVVKMLLIKRRIWVSGHNDVERRFKIVLVKYVSKYQTFLHHMPRFVFFVIFFRLTFETFRGLWTYKPRSIWSLYNVSSILYICQLFFLS